MVVLKYACACSMAKLAWNEAGMTPDSSSKAPSIIRLSSETSWELARRSACMRLARRPSQFAAKGGQFILMLHREVLPHYE